MPTMDSILDRHFAFIGARMCYETAAANVPAIDIRRDRRGEYFDLRLPDGASTSVLNTNKEARHLLLLVNVDGEKSRFLCGHDERHWFVAAIPESERGVIDVVAAQRALMPTAVRDAARRLRARNRHRRRNPAYVRQGEWFFVPALDINPEWWTVLRNEPLSRGRGKSHVMEFAYRRGGVTVYVNRSYPGGLTQAEYDALEPDVRNGQAWRQMVRDAEAYASGRISHPDHATVVLNGWHRVFMNTENRAKAMRHVAFLD
jgi:hypothetical protein